MSIAINDNNEKISSIVHLSSLIRCAPIQMLWSAKSLKIFITYFFACTNQSPALAMHVSQITRIAKALIDKILKKIRKGTYRVASGNKVYPTHAIPYIVYRI